MTPALLIRTSKPHRIIVELDRPEIALAIDRTPDGNAIAAWLSTASGKVIQRVNVGQA